MRRVAGVLGCVVVFAAVVWWWTGHEGSTPARVTIEDGGVTAEELAEQQSSGPLLRGSGEEISVDAWLVATVLEAPSRTPIADTKFMFRFRRPTAGQYEEHVIVTTDAEGTARIGPLATSDFEVFVGARAHRNTPDWLRPTQGDEGNLTVEVVLERGHAITGRLLLPEGLPASAARLRIKMGNSIRTGTEVEIDGSFACEGMDEGEATITVIAVHDGKRWFGQATTSTDAAPVAIEMHRARQGDPTYTHIRVETTEGEPASAIVSFEQSSPSFTSWQGGVHVREEATIEHDAHEYADLIVFARPTDAPDRGEVVVAPLPADTTRIVVRLPRARALTGRVVGPDGGGVANVAVTVAHEHPRRRDEPFPALPAVRTDERGAFSYDGLGAGEYMLTVEVPPAYQTPAPRSVRAGADDVLVTLTRGTAVTIVVRDVGGTPMAGARVSANRPRAGPTASAVTDAEGRCRLERLDDETTYDLIVQPPAERLDALAQLREDWTPEPTELQLERAFTITGHLRDPDGKPMPRTPIECTRVGTSIAYTQPVIQYDGTIAQREPSARTAADGSFTIHGLREGRYRLGVPGVADAQTVDAGASGVELVGATLHDLTVQVVDWNLADRGKWMMFRASGTTGGGLQNRVDEGGRVTLGKVRASESFDVWMGDMANGRYVWTKGVTATDGVVELRPQVGGTARGRLVAPDGVALTGTTVVANGPISYASFPEDSGMVVYGALGHTLDEKTGAFTITGLPPGTWKIEFWVEHGEDFYGGETSVRAGDDVQVRLKKDE